MPKYTPRQRVLICSQYDGDGSYSAGTVVRQIDPKDCLDGDWEIASDSHRHIVVRYDREMEPMPLSTKDEET